MKRIYSLPILLCMLFLRSVTIAQPELMDSLKNALKLAKHDTSRCGIYDKMVEAESDINLWPVYNKEMQKIAEENLKKNLSAAEEKCFKKYLANSFSNYGYLLTTQGKTQDGIDYSVKALALQREIGNKQGVATTLVFLGNAYHRTGDAVNSLKYFGESLKLSRELKDKNGEGLALYFIGWTYDDKGEIEKALDYYQQSLKIAEELKDPNQMARSINNIAYIYNSQGDVKTALEYYGRSLKLYEEAKNLNGIASALNNIGNIHYKHSQLEKALDNYNKALIKFESIEDKNGIGYALNNLGNVWAKQKVNDKALAYYERSLAVRREIQDMQGVSISCSNIGEIHYLEGRMPQAEKYCSEGLKIAQELEYAEGVKTGSRLLYQIYEKQGKGLPALQMHKLYIKMRDSLNNIATQKAVITQYAKQTYEKKAAADSVRVAEEKKVTAIQLKQEKTFRYSLVVGLVLLLGFSVVVLNRFRVTKKQKHIIEKQKEVVFEKQKEIVESINYAKRLQDAILPPLEYINRYVPQNFVLYKPKDIVAGDFYWAENINDLFFIAAADCTGHGVPGAMMSVVCSNALNRSVKEFNLTEVGKVLDKTRELVLETFVHAGDQKNEVKDGMDISLLCIDKKNKKIFWCGANNPLWYVVENEMKEIKSDKQPIGMTDNPRPFTTHTVEYKEGNMFYLFTDGFADQFGGPNGKKFKYKQFSELLLKNSTLTPKQQMEGLMDAFDKWKGNLEQIDDVCVIGVRI